MIDCKTRATIALVTDSGFEQIGRYLTGLETATCLLRRIDGRPARGHGFVTTGKYTLYCITAINSALRTMSLPPGPLTVSVTV